jgi:hypothetical protein
MDIRTVNGALHLFPVATGGAAHAPGRGPNSGQIHHPGASTLAAAPGGKAISPSTTRGQQPTQGRFTRLD